MRETGSNSLEKKQKREFVRAEIDDQYSMTKICPKCGTTMVYAFGETYECPKCGNKEYTDFGKIREYLETHGPQNAVTIAAAWCSGSQRRQRRAAKSERGQFGISCMGSHIRNNSNP